MKTWSSTGKGKIVRVQLYGTGDLIMRRVSSGWPIVKVERQRDSEWVTTWPALKDDGSCPSFTGTQPITCEWPETLAGFFEVIRRDGSADLVFLDPEFKVKTSIKTDKGQWVKA